MVVVTCLECGKQVEVESIEEVQLKCDCPPVYQFPYEQLNDGRAQ